MAKKISFFQNSQTAHARRSRTLLLPLPRIEADKLALYVHVALDAMRLGHGNVSAAQTLTQAMIIVGLLAQAGYGSVTAEQLLRAEQAIFAAFDRGRDTGIWLLDHEAFALFARVVTAYDYQLQRAPLSAIADASRRLDCFQAGSLPKWMTPPTHAAIVHTDQTA